MAKKRSAADIQKEIDSYQALLDDSTTPADEKAAATDEIADLKKELAKAGKGGNPKPATSKVKHKKSAAAKSEKPKVPKELSDCEELIKKNRKPRAEPVHHTRETRFTNALGTITNVLLEGHEEDQAMIERVGKAVATFEMKCKEDFLGLKRPKRSPEIKEKIADAITDAK